MVGHGCASFSAGPEYEEVDGEKEKEEEEEEVLEDFPLDSEEDESWRFGNCVRSWRFRRSERCNSGAPVGMWTCPHQVLAATLTLPGGQIMPTLY